MSHGDENQDEDKDSNDENSNKATVMLQDSSLERHWLQCYLKLPGSLEEKANGNHAEASCLELLPLLTFTRPGPPG